MAEDMGEKTEDPTAKRRYDSRQRGQVAKSNDLSGAIIMIGAAGILAFFGREMLAGLARLTQFSLGTGVLDADLTIGSLPRDLQITVGEMARLVLPVMLIMFFVAAVAQILQVGALFTLQPLKPNWKKFNIIAGFGKFFSRKNFVKGAIDVMKLTLIASVTAAVVRSEMANIAHLAMLPITEALVIAAWIMLHVAAWVLLILFVLGILDFLFQRWQTTHDMRMTRQEVRDERKASDGDPETKSRRMRMARQIALQRIGADVPKADVIVTNPTHYSVALQYEVGTMSAPRVIAKGADFLALRIRQIAALNGVPIIERPPLARALYHQVDVGREVSLEHYEAVAEVLAYVYRLEGKMAS